MKPVYETDVVRLA